MPYPSVRPLLLALALCALAPSARAAGPENYALDPVHTRVMFAISHAGFSKALGTVSGSTGTLSFDREDWRSARLDVRVPVAKLDLGDAKWNAAALGAGLLDGQRHPEARFVSDRVEPVAADRARVCGQLTLRGRSRPLCMDVTLNALKRHPLPPFRRTAGFSATATLSRADFGIDAWKSVIGDSVELRIEAEAVRDRNAGEADEPAPPPSEPEAAPNVPAPKPDTDPYEPVPVPHA
ncbi:YceI family protein [Lysobacter silvisoli]|uniref:YceI family protein n=1 Tax=Lysobacter silvisoli TaxID=2293254 RepID=UPI0026CF3381